MNIARIIYDNYPGADGLIPDDQLTDLGTLYHWVCQQEHFGDSLLKFIIVEAKEGGEASEGGKVEPERVGEALTRVLEDLDAVIDALAKAIDAEPQAEP